MRHKKIIIAAMLISLMLSTSYVKGQTSSVNFEVGDEFSVSVDMEDSHEINDTLYGYSEMNSNFDVEVTGIGDDYVNYTAVNDDKVTYDTNSEIDSWYFIYFIVLLPAFFMAFFDPEYYSFEAPDVPNTGYIELWEFPIFVSNNESMYEELADNYEEGMAEMEEETSKNEDDNSYMEYDYDPGKSLDLTYVLDLVNETSDWLYEVYTEINVEIDIENGITKYLGAEVSIFVEIDDATELLELKLEIYEGFRLFGLNNSPLYVFAISLFAIAMTVVNKRKRN
ncbi:MAG: hypothetical protein OEY49_03720 [Candidatus Heimdallarchaeota archaeon]|nr:hypothetical protein [Candidatus Heimdallarchaeota archaeon]